MFSAECETSEIKMYCYIVLMCMNGFFVVIVCLNIFSIPFPYLTLYGFYLGCVLQPYPK